MQFSINMDITRKEFVAQQYRVYFAKTRTRVLLISYPFLLVALYYVMTKISHQPEGTALTAVVFLFAFMALLMIVYGPVWGRYYDKSPLPDGIVYTFADDGIKVETKGSNGMFQWSTVTAITQVKKFYIVKIDKRGFIYIRRNAISLDQLNFIHEKSGISFLFPGKI